MPPVDKDLTAPAWMEKAPLSPNSLYPAELNPSPGAPVMFGSGPNISGAFNANNGIGTKGQDYFWPEGAFFCTDETEPRRPGNAGGSGPGGRLSLTASGSSSLYGGASTVQPASVRVLACIKA